ncbi:glycerol-3-phosphate acyltransferase RAM2-like [Oryza brachyantha]|uniref:glycerol-3-phosphate acyltransferase RAM2-like n=1 Tax=Oryza brachyantha TaxID=4533 RepID=UPI001ADA4967|nr:glycerol-3-phosphate acyltransferase RAM2-like [Oryza brachyantha]
MATQRRHTSVAAELEGTLLISGDLFPYFLLVALEAGGPLRAVVLLAVYPLVALLGVALSDDDLPVSVMTFVSTAGLAVADVAAVAKVTLPRFLLGDLRDSAFRAFARHAGGERYVVTRLPTVMVEPFVREYVAEGARVVGTELRVVGRRFTGTAVVSPGVAVAGGDRSLGALVAVLGRDRIVDVGLCSGDGAVNRQPAFMQICQERRVVATPDKAPATPLPRSEYRRPLIFHDGRLVGRPEPLACLAVVMWLPLGVVLAVTRILIGVFPYGVSLLLAAATGFQIRAHLGDAAATGAPPERRLRGTLYACNHQTLMDPVILSTVVHRKVTAVTYSLSGLSELIAPIPTVRLTRDRGRDQQIMQSVLARGDLAVCPEGTTCREPYMLRFSPLFAEIADEVTPVAVRAGGAMFHGTTVRGHKWMDSFFFLMNPSPWYHVRLLPPVSSSSSCGGDDGDASSHDVANRVQRVIGDAIGFECTALTRRDKYRMIAGHDGVDARAS